MASEEDFSWMDLPTTDDEWQRGFDRFIEDTFESKFPGESVQCPCARCRCMAYQDREAVEHHLVTRGFDRSFIKTQQERHHPAADPIGVDDDGEGEGGDADHDDREATSTLFSSLISAAIHGGSKGGNEEEPNEPAKNFFKLMEEARKELYPGCKEASKVSFIVRLFQIKCMCGFSNAAMEQILFLFSLVLPKGHCLPDSLDKVRKVVRDLGLDYQKIHACINDCVLFRGDYENMDNCPTCKESRWKFSDSQQGPTSVVVTDATKKKRLPRKVLRYFPLIPRLQRLYMNETTSSYMRWHKEDLVEDGKARHPANSKAWKHVDAKFEKEFAYDPRNVRLGLAADGFNPFGKLNVTYSTLPVILIPYNLPPWLCLKQSFWMLSMLIPGPKSPGINIDVYLQPLIDELKKLWYDGVDTWDAKEKRNFKLRAMLLWTINDFPAYAMLSGWSTKGRFACPYCHKDTDYMWLKFGMKHCYMGHRRFLPIKHKWRRVKVSFNNEVEEREAPVPLSGQQVREQYETFEQTIFGAITSKKRKQRDEDTRWHNWRKKSIFFDLPYWDSLLIRHNLDVMHIEKNICESLLGTLLHLAGKGKDSERARLDLKELGIRKDQHPVLNEKGKYDMPTALYTLGDSQKEILCKFLQGVRMPDGYAANIRRCVDVDARKVSGLKSHDYHVILQKLLPFVVRDILPDEVVIPLIQLSRFFNMVCSKEIDKTEMQELSKSIAETLCRLEMIFPPAFFDIMMHLPVHIASEAELGGPASYRWMYPVERYLRTLKGYVRNKSCPEGSIAEGYISEECLTFCSRFFEGVNTKLNRPERQENSTVNEPPAGLSVFASVDSSKKKTTSKHNMEMLESDVLLVMRHYIISNCDEAIPWINEHKSELAKVSLQNVERRHKEHFVPWFKRKIRNLHREGKADEMIYSLSHGPNRLATVKNRCSINGFYFRALHAEKNLTTQNSGVVVKGDGGMEWYGVIKKVIVLEFSKSQEVMLFQCDWFNVPGPGQSRSRGYTRDKFGIIDIDTSLFRYSEDPYILATQAEQVCYVKSGKKEKWCSVLKMKPRSLFAMPEGEEDADINVGNTDMDEVVIGVENISVQDHNQDLSNWRRGDVQGTSVDASVLDQVTPMPEPDHADIPEGDDNGDETYIGDGVVAPVNSDGEDDDGFFS